MEANNQTKNQKNFLTSLKELATTSYGQEPPPASEDGGIPRVFVENLEPKEELRLEMSRISEAGYCTGWNVDLEFFLWQAVNGGSREFGVKTITDAEIAHLKTLSEQSGGWWHWSEERTKTLFIPMEQWQEIYRDYLKDNSL